MSVLAIHMFSEIYEDRDLGTLLHIHQTRRNRDAPDERRTGREPTHCVKDMSNIRSPI